MDYSSALAYSVTKFIQFFILIVCFYYFIISLFGWIKKTDSDIPDNIPAKRFVVVIAAHNEELVIGHIIDSLHRQNYPKHLFDIYVIADNCTDKTSKISQEHGAVVYERTNAEERGKGYALEWMFNKILKMETHYDAVCVFDADNLVSANFLQEMNKQLAKGYKAVQGYIDSKNPFDSWITCSYSISFWLANRLFQLPRYNLGLTCGLCGTGFCVDLDTLRKTGWGATCLTEDLEFTIRLALKNIKIGWAHNAVVYDEKPLTLKQSWKQRKRWMQGHADCAVRYLPSMILKAFTDKDPIAIDCALYLFQPLWLILVGSATFFMWIQSIFPSAPVFNIKEIFSNNLWDFIVLFQFFYGPMVVGLEKKFDFRIIFGFLIYPLYCLTWVPIAIQGIAARNDKTWSHTSHTRKISINDFEKAR